MKRSQTLLRLLLSVVVSLGVLGLIFALVREGETSVNHERLFEVLRSVAVPFVVLYFFCNLLQIFVRALRYRLLLRVAGEENVPSFWHVLWVTQARNMFVDLFPARVGELSYIALLNRGYQVRGETCLSSLAVSFVFDFVALFVVLIALGVRELWVTGTLGYLGYVLIALLVVIGIGLFCLFTALPVITAWIHKTVARFFSVRILGKILNFFDKFAGAIVLTRQSHALMKVLALSILVRLGKYVGIYFLFLAVSRSSFPEMAVASMGQVLVALLGAEAASALPLPTFMSFGSYEAGGVMAWTGLGFSSADAAICMLAIHICSQIVDYTLGGLGLVMIAFTARLKKGRAL